MCVLFACISVLCIYRLKYMFVYIEIIAQYGCLLLMKKQWLPVSCLLLYNTPKNSLFVPLKTLFILLSLHALLGCMKT